jgi:signal transduction histidine kinase
MVLNEEHVALEDWFKLVLAVLERERYELRPRKESPEGVQPLFEAFDLTPTVKEVQSQLGPRHPVTKLVSDAGDNIKKGVERVQEAFSRLLMLSGLGQMIDIVIHEIGAPIGKIGRQLVTIEKEVGSIPDPKIREKVMETLRPLRAWLDQVLLLRQRLDPQTPSKRGRATVFSVKDAVEDCFQLCEALLKNQRVEAEILEPDGPIRARMSRAVIDQILYNLADNAIFWIAQQHGQGKGGRIQVKVAKSKGGFRVIFCDDGTGISQEDRTRVFEPYFTTKPNGMGLGLHVARMVIEPYGKLLLHEEGDLPGACFEARFEQSVGL